MKTGTNKNNTIDNNNSAIERWVIRIAFQRNWWWIPRSYVVVSEIPIQYDTGSCFLEAHSPH